MPRSVFVDTNILVDAAVPGREFHPAALMLEEEVAYGGLQAYIAATSLKDIYYLVKRETDEAFAREYVQCLMRLYATAAVDAAICEQAAFSDEPDFEDGIIRACAESLGVDYIISRDQAAFENSSIKRLSAQEYVEAFTDFEPVEL